MLGDDTHIAWVVGVPGNDRFVVVTVHVAEITKAGMEALVLADSDDTQGIGWRSESPSDVRLTAQVQARLIGRGLVRWVGFRTRALRATTARAADYTTP